VSAVAFSRGGTRIVSGSWDGSVREWDAVAGLPIPAEQGADIRAVAFSPTGDQMASAGADGTVKLWNAKTAALIRRLGQPSSGYDHAINSLAFNPQDGSQIVTGSTDGDVRVWNLDNPQSVKTLPKVDPPGPPLAGKSRIQSVAFSGDGRRIVSGGFDSAVRLWNAQTLAPIGAVSANRSDEHGKVVPYQVWSVAFSPDGHQIASGSGFDLDAAGQNNLIQLWNVEPILSPNGPPIRGQEGGWNILSVGFSPGGERIVSGSFDGTVRLWNSVTREEEGDPMSGDQNPVFSVAFANHHQWIATGGQGNTVRVWDTKNEPPAGMPLEGHQNWVQSVAFSPDDQWILSGSGDGTLHLWPAPQRLTDTVCSKLTTNISRKQWSEWVPSQIDYIPICPDLPVAPD
jgi:WD40 repeat protein